VGQSFELRALHEAELIKSFAHRDDGFRIDLRVAMP
jgi:hypothetical protein